MIYYGRQNINAKDIQSVVDVLNSDFLTQGPVLEQFEKKVADYCGAKYAVAVTNATSALHIACRAAGLGEGDPLWTSPITFTASANCGRYCGADVDFVDINSATYNMSVTLLAEKLEKAKKNGYYIRMYYVALSSLNESCIRIENRVRKGGHDIPKEDVTKRFAKRFDDVIKVLPYCDEVHFYDNENGFIDAGEYKNGEIVIKQHTEWLDQLKNEFSDKQV